jgi:hypothetical protein
MIALAFSAGWVDQDRAHEMVARVALRSLKITVEPVVDVMEA